MTRHENTCRYIPHLVQFMTIVVDLVIVNVAIAAAQQQPGLAASVLLSSVILYGLLFGSFVLLGGWLGQALSRGRVVVTPDATPCFARGSGAETWPPASWCPCCRGSAS